MSFMDWLPVQLAQALGIKKPDSQLTQIEVVGPDEEVASEPPEPAKVCSLCDAEYTDYSETDPTFAEYRNRFCLRCAIGISNIEAEYDNNCPDGLIPEELYFAFELIADE